MKRYKEMYKTGKERPKLGKIRFRLLKKMKKLFLLLMLCGLISQVYAQDLIITNEGDSINCKITQIKGDLIYFNYKPGDTERKSVLSTKNIELYHRNFYFVDRKPVETQSTPKEISPLRVAFGAGWSYRTAKLPDGIPSNMEDYLKDVKSGMALKAGIQYFFSESWGLGLKYDRHLSSNSEPSISFPDLSGSSSTGRVEDDISITFIGPGFSTRTFNVTKENAFIASLSLGYMGYKNNAVLFDDHFKLSGETIGLAWDLGYDIGISESVALGFELSLLTGSLKKLKLNNGGPTTTINLQKENYENLSRIDLSFGIRFK